MKRREKKESRENYSFINHDGDPDYVPELSELEKKAIEAGFPMTIIHFDDEHHLAHKVSFNMDDYPPPELTQLFAQRLFPYFKEEMDRKLREAMDQEQAGSAADDSKPRSKKGDVPLNEGGETNE